MNRKETPMKLRRKACPIFLSASVVLIFVLAMSQSFEGRPPRAAQTPVQVSVAGHLELQGMSVKHIFVQQRGSKHFLLLRRADKNAFAIVDVTNPGNPILTDRSALPEPAGGSVDLPAQGSALAIAFVPDSASAAAAGKPTNSLPTETVRLIDLGDPRHPKTVKTFNNVTSVASDDGRKLVFLVNNEGLWVISHFRNRPLPLCTSESEIQPLPDCQ
jgi:hypothetical protein